MSLYLLDTDVVIDYLNRIPASIYLLRTLSSEMNRLCTCAVVIAEVYAGLQPKDEGRAQQIIPTLLFLDTPVSAAERAGRWRYEFARTGRALSTTDVLIAATSVEHAATIITGNARDYPMPEISLLPLPR